MTDQVTFKDARAGTKGTVHVFLGKKRVGTIIDMHDGWQYRPMGASSQSWGDKFPTLEGCKRSVRGCDD